MVLGPRIEYRRIALSTIVDETGATVFSVLTSPSFSAMRVVAAWVRWVIQDPGEGLWQALKYLVLSVCEFAGYLP